MQLPHFSVWNTQIWFNIPKYFWARLLFLKSLLQLVVTMAIHSGKGGNRSLKEWQQSQRHRIDTWTNLISIALIMVRIALAGCCFCSNLDIDNMGNEPSEQNDRGQSWPRPLPPFTFKLLQDFFLLLSFELLGNKSHNPAPHKQWTWKCCRQNLFTKQYSLVFKWSDNNWNVDTFKYVLLLYFTKK